MLDPDVPDERRDEIAAETRKRIEAGGTLKHDTSWGMRKMAYEIRQRTEADYRLFRFEGQSGVLDDLNHNLRIADGVLRFRIFKVDPRAPSVSPPPPVATSGAPTAAPAARRLPLRRRRRGRQPAEAPAEAPPEGRASRRPPSPRPHSRGPRRGGPRRQPTPRSRQSPLPSRSRRSPRRRSPPRSPAKSPPSSHGG